MRKIMIAAVIVCIFLTGCKSVTPALGTGVEKTAESSGQSESGEEAETLEQPDETEGLESLKQLESLKPLESMEELGIKELENNWPESLCYNADGVSGNPIYTEIEIDTPMTLSVYCETLNGSLRLKIVNKDTGWGCFEEKDPDGEYTVEIDKAGAYQILFYAKEHVGSVQIVPEGTK